MRKIALAVAAAAVLALAVAGAAPASASHRPGRALGTTSLNNTSCHNEWILAVSNGTNNPGGHTQWVRGGGTTVNGCSWYQRVHLHCGIPSLNLDYGWHDGGWVTSGIESGVTCPNGSHWIVFDVQWQHQDRATTYTKRLAP